MQRPVSAKEIFIIIKSVASRTFVMPGASIVKMLTSLQTAITTS
jgi:hypothetical protein